MVQALAVQHLDSDPAHAAEKLLASRIGAEMRVFFDDVAVRSALTMLDWCKKKIALFKYRDEGDLKEVDVDYETVASALASILKRGIRKFNLR